MPEHTMTKRPWLIGLVLILSIPLAFLVKDFVRDVLLVELMRMVWTVGILFDSLPQALIWAMFLLLALNVAVRSLIAARRRGQRGSRFSSEPVGQVQRLAMRIRSTDRAEYHTWHLTRHLAKLVAAVLAFREGTTPSRATWKVRSGSFEGPEEVRTYLQRGVSTKPFEPTGPLVGLRRRFTQSPHHHPVDPRLEAVVRFLEDKLEE
jgi:hypothetical protein